MDDKVRIALRNLVTEQGEPLLSSRERLRGLLSDDCPECTKEINVLMIAVQAQVAAELRSYPASTDTRVALSTTTLRLERAFSLGRGAAAWAVLTIAYALGRITDDQFQSLLPALSVESGISPPPVPPPTEPKRPPPPPPAPPPPRPVSQPPAQPYRSPSQPSQPPTWAGSQPYSPPPPPPVSPVYQPVAPLNPNPPVYPQSPPPIPGQAPIRQPGSGIGKGAVIGIGVGVLLVGSILYTLAHRSTDSQSPPGEQSQSQPGGQSQPGSGGTGPSTPPSSQSTQASYGAYSDASGLFDVEVPGGWLFKRSDTDTTLEKVACHMVLAGLYPKDAQHADLDGWFSAGIRITIYLPPNGQIWLTDWATDWQKRTFGGRLQGYTKYQNTNIETVKLGNVSADSTAVEGESQSISETEVARLYIATSPKYLLVVDVQMPASQRALFDAVDQRLRQTFALKVQ